MGGLSKGMGAYKWSNKSGLIYGGPIRGREGKVIGGEIPYGNCW